MAYELVKFSPGNQPSFLKVVTIIVATCLAICVLIVKFYPAKPEGRIEMDFTTSEVRDAQNELKQAKSHLDALKAGKASGQTTAPWGAKEIQIDNAIKLGEASLELIAHKVSREQIKLTSLEQQRALAEQETLKIGGVISIILGVILGYLIWLSKRNKAEYAAAMADMAKRGHNPDFQVGNALVSSKTKMIAFVDLRGKTYDLYDARDILGWEHQWTDKTTASTNVWGDSIRASTRQADNVLVFKTNNLAKPLYKVSVASHRIGEEWMARLGAIING